MKLPKTTLLTAAWLIGMQALYSDTIVMKNGDTYEGRVLREVDDSYVLEVKISASIRDEIKVLKSDVRYIDKEEPDLKAFEALKEILPTPELLKEAEYEALIAKVDEFLEAHPKSISISKAKEIKETLEEELGIVRDGGMKLGEEMIQAEDYAANAYEYDALIEAKQIKDAVNRRDVIEALRKFSKYDKVFQNADGRDEVASLIEQVLVAYGATIKQSQQSLESRLEKRAAGLNQMSAEDRTQTERALKEEMDRVEKRFKAEKDAKEEWVTPDAFYKESLDEAGRQVERELRRLETGNRRQRVPDQPVAETYRNAWKDLEEGTEQEKRAVLSAARTGQVPDVYLKKLQERAGLETF